MEAVISFTPWLRLAIGAIGVLVITVGVFRLFFSFLKQEIRLKKRDELKACQVDRQVLGSYLLLGLEFLVAADIVETILKPSLMDLASLGAIVIIRTVLSYFLNKEMREIVDGGEM